MPQSDDPVLTPAEQETGMSTSESEMNLDTSSPEYAGSGKKTSLFGKLMDKTKNTVSQLKSKVGKKKSGGTPADGGPDEDEEDNSKDQPASAEDAPPAPTTPSTTEPVRATNSTQVASGAQEGQTDPTPASIPQNVDDVGSGQPEPKPQPETPPESTPRSLEPDAKLSGTDATATEDPAAPSSGGDKFEDATAENQDSSAAQPRDPALDQDSSGATPAEDHSYTDKAAKGAQGLKDAAFGTTAAAAGAVGYDKLSESGNTSQEPTKPQSDSPEVQENAQDAGQEQAPNQDSSGTPPPDNQSFTDKAAGGAQGLKDAAYGTAAAAGADLGYDKLTESGKTDQDTNRSQDDTPGVQEKAQDLGQQASHSVIETANTVSEKANEGATQAQESSPDIPASATEAGNQVKDVVAGKASDLNYATGDSQTYTEKLAEKGDQLNNATSDSQTYTDKAVETAAAVIGGVAATLGMEKAGDGTSVADKTKGYLNSAVDNTKAYTQAATDKSKETAGAGSGTTKDTTGSVMDSTKDKMASVTGAVQEAAQSTYDSAKGYMQSGTDTTKNYVQQAVDATKGYTQSATDTSKGYASRSAEQAAAARDTAIDKVTPKDEHKALSDNVTETISNLPAQFKDSITNAVQGVNSPSAAQDDAQKDAGLLGRFTGLLFGKKPENETQTTGETTAAEEQPTSEPNAVQQ